MTMYSITDVDSVGIVAEHSVVSIRIYDADGNYIEFDIKANAAHVGCSGLVVRKQFHEYEEPDWIDLEQASE